MFITNSSAKWEVFMYHEMDGLWLIERIITTVEAKESQFGSYVLGAWLNHYSLVAI